MEIVGTMKKLQMEKVLTEKVLLYKLQNKQSMKSKFVHKSGLPKGYKHTRKITRAVNGIML